MAFDWYLIDGGLPLRVFMAFEYYKNSHYTSSIAVIANYYYSNSTGALDHSSEVAIVDWSTRVQCMGSTLLLTPHMQLIHKSIRIDHHDDDEHKQSQTAF